MDKTIAIRIDAILHRRIKIRLAENRLTLKDYIVGLIGNDLKDCKPLIFADLTADGMINAESIEEAQKVLDFARNIFNNRKEI